MRPVENNNKEEQMFKGNTGSHGVLMQNKLGSSNKSKKHSKQLGI